MYDRSHKLTSYITGHQLDPDMSMQDLMVCAWHAVRRHDRILVTKQAMFREMRLEEIRNEEFRAKLHRAKILTSARIKGNSATGRFGGMGKDGQWFEVHRQKLADPFAA